MTETTHKFVRTKEFSPEDAGKRVGWASVFPIPTRDDLLSVNIVTTTVGPEGAVHGYFEDIDPETNEPRRLFSSNNSRGFLHTAGLAVLIMRNEPIQHGTWDFAFHNRKDILDRSSNVLTAGATHRYERAPDDEYKEWLDDRFELLELLKTELGKEGALDYYPTIYYLLNTLFTHPDLLKHAAYADADLSSMVMPDISMTKTTAEQLTHAARVAKQLRAIDALDADLQKKLTVFGGVAPHDIPRIFTTARRLAHTHERDAFNEAQKLAVPSLSYKPRDGRSWPYMDAAESNERAAFSKELKALKRQDIWPASDELERERKSLESRISYTVSGILSLEALAGAEIARARELE